MLEGLVAGLLNRFLGMYVKNFDPKQLKVGIWSGDVKLNDLELRKEALDQLKLPINVVEGHLGNLKLVIPWSNLRGSAVQVFIEDVFLLASPKEEAEYNEEEEERRQQRLKMEKLESAELLKERNQEGLSQEEQQKNQSFAQSLVTKIVDNLQVTVKNIHIRYEDSISAPGHPFALGVTLEEFSATSTDGEWKPTFIQDANAITHKLAKLNALAVYWNTDTTLLGSGREAPTSEEETVPHDEMMGHFRQMIVKGEDPTSASHQFILKPVTGEARLEIDKSGDIHIPKFKGNLVFDEIGLVLDDDQYRDGLMMVDLFHYFVRHQEYKKYQPKGVRPKEDPRAWLQFAGNAILSKIHERNYRWTWEYFKERRDNRRRYIELFKMKKQSRQLTSQESSDLDELEWKLPYEDLRFWRSLARNQLRKENAEALKNQPPKQNQQQQQGWLSWAWGSKPQHEQEQVTEEGENTQMTEQQRQELYNAIDWDEKNAIAAEVDVPRDAVKLQIEASLKTGSFTLKQSPHGNTKDLLSFHFDVLKGKGLVRPDSLLADISLGGLRVNDGTTPESLFPEIVRVKDAPKVQHSRRISLAELEESNDEAFFSLQFEKNPLDGQGDYALTTKLKPLEIIWNPNFVVGIVDFFRPPERHMESVTALMETAGATVEGLREQTRAGLEFALEEHRTVYLKLDLQAPLIIVPQNIKTRESTCLILDAGHISVNSELVDKTTMKDIQSKQSQAYTEEDMKKLQSLMYDRFIVKLSSTQLLIGPSIEETKAQLTADKSSSMMHIVEKINIDFVVETCIVPKSPTLTKLKVSGHLPVLRVTASDTKYKNLMKIIDVAVPKLDDDDQAGSPQGPQQNRPRLTSNVSTRSNRSARNKHSRKQSSQLLPFNTQQTAIILDDDFDDDDDNFEDADDGTVNEQMKMKQKSFDFKFTADKLVGALYMSDSLTGTSDRLLVELVAQRFDLDFYLRPYDMVAEVSLGSVTVDDFVDKNVPEEFKAIVSSGDVEDREQERDLVSVKFTRVKKESPEFMSVYNGVETNVDVTISTINLVVTRNTLLTLLDFILKTFTNVNNNNGTTRQVEASSEETDASHGDVTIKEPESPPENQAGAIRVKVDLKSIRLILNNDGIRLATLSFNHADVGVFLLGKTMRVSTKLGDLSLIDDVNLGVSEESALRRLVTIEGDELADFRYETFDASSKTYPGHDSSIYLRAGSIKVNFLEEPFRKILGFLVVFGQQHALFNDARQAAVKQANQLQQSGSRFKFDVVVKTPIVVFPRVLTPGRQERDLLTAYLGEIYAQNKFVPLDDSEDAEIADKLSAGIRNIKLVSLFHYAGGKSEELELIDHVDLGLNMTYAEHKPGVKRPDREVEASMTDFNLRLTQYQLKFLLEISRSVPAAFAIDSDAEESAKEDVDDSTVEIAERVRSMNVPDDKSSVQSSARVDLGPELGTHEETWTQLDVVFKVGTIGLELINGRENEPIGNVANASLSRFSLDNSKLKFRMISNGSLEAELVIDSFTIHDSRPRETNKFRRIMTSANKEVQQFMASFTMSGGKRRDMIAIAAIDSPRIIFALDYIFAIQKFVTASLEVEPSPADNKALPETPDESDVESTAERRAIKASQKSQVSKSHKSRKSVTSANDESAAQKEDGDTSFSFRVNVVDAQVILIANPLSSSSEAIVLGTKQVLLSQQHVLTFQVSEVGMFLCRMDRFDDTRLRIIDDFSIQMYTDNTQPTLSKINVDIEPLILRLSLRDILLALQIISKASELSDSEQPSEQKPSASDQKAKQLRQAGLKQRTASGRGQSTMAGNKTQTVKTTATNTRSQRAGSQVHDTKPAPVHHEKLSATIDGIRVVLIGDVHELPILDMSIKKFDATAQDWSTNLKAELPIQMYINVYNFAKSSWEPLLEPWQVGLGVAREQESGLLSVDVVSPKVFDITVTTASIALASKSFDFLTQDQDVLSKPRGGDAPYRIRNYSGFDCAVNSKNASTSQNIEVRLEDGQEAPWSFENWERMRENLSTDSNSNTIMVQLEGSGFDTVKNIRINREGEFLHALKPKTNQVLHRLLVEVSLGDDNVKYVTLRSPLLVENHTHIPVELGVYDSQDGNLLKIEKIAPGESRPAPVGAAYTKSLLVRPDSGFGYQWSTEPLSWRDLLKRPTRTMVCKGEQGGDPFYFQLNATFDRANPLTKNYPFMRLKLSPPVVLENLLPFDFKYNIYEKNTKSSTENFLRKGGVSPIHAVHLSNLLLLCIDMQDTVFNKSEFAVINPGSNPQGFPREEKLTLRDDRGRALQLSLYYHTAPGGGGAFKVTVYSPYVILNKTGLDIAVKSKGYLQQAKAAAGQNSTLVDVSEGDRPKATPFMFSFGAHEHERSRAMLQVADSQWSKPLSFDAIGTPVEVVLPSSSGHSEIHCGLISNEGEGKYKMTKVVTLTPRFIIQNKTGEEINIRQQGSSGLMTLKDSALQPLHFLQKNSIKQLCLCPPGVNNQWSSPFNIADIGLAHVKITKAGQRQRLVRVDTLLEDATIFVNLSMETKAWPFSMRNESDTEFVFFQANPNMDEDDTEDRSGWRPIRYRLPPRSIMPYAWDFPAAKRREVVINAYGRERYVQMAEIGELVPFKVTTPSGQKKSFNVNVTAEGPTQTLILSNYREKMSFYRQKTNSGSGTSTGAFEVKENPAETTFQVNFKLSGVGVSLINAQLKELAYITLRDAIIRYNESTNDQTITLNIKWVQIDNQLYGGIFPMIFYPSVVQKKAQELEERPIFHAQARKLKDDSYGVLFIKYATLLLQQMTIDLDEDFIYAVLEYSKVPGASWTKAEEEGRLCDESFDIPEPKGQQSGQSIYFDWLNFQPMQLDLSFMRTERVNADNKTSSHNPLMFFFNVMTSAMGSVNDAPIRLNALALKNARVSVPELTEKLSAHYRNEFLSQIHKVIGSADFLGNPVGLFNNISSGLTDIFYEPYQGLILSDKPEDLGLGIAKGAASFVKKSVYGFSDTFSKLTGSWSKGLAAATLDKQFQDRRRITRARNRPKHALYGVTAGANSLFTSVASGVGGLARKPLEGAEQDGALGFFKGVGKGVLGFATKPAIGVLDLASNVSEGIRNTTTVFDGSELDRVRLPRHVPADGVVRPYDQREALGQSWLKQVDNGKYFDESYIAHLELPREDMVVMVTYARILLIRSRRLTAEWDIPMKDIQTISKERTGLSISLRGGANGPFIPVGEESGRNFLYKNVAVAVNEFNYRFKGLE